MSDNSRIAKNTLFLSFRMIFLLLISLYTSRVVLNILGVENYGIYNVVGGLVAFVSYINQAMSSSTLRFVTYSLGKNDIADTKKVFNTGFVIHGIIALLIILLGETVGLWFFFEKLQIPEGRESVALIIYQLSLVSTSMVILNLPYNALIIAHEKMSAFAYFSIFDAILKLLIVYLLLVVPFDKLLVYGVFMMTTQLIYCLIYLVYCRTKFVECRLNLKMDRQLAKEMTGFAGWSMFGCTAAITYTQGLNLLLNMFGGAVVNAARGIAVQVQGVVTNFTANFQTAINPQIIKKYAQQDYAGMYQLIYYAAKYSFILMWLLSVPIILNMETVLTWWLKIVPDHTTEFLQVLLVIIMIDSVSNPLMKSADATGKIRNYHIIVGCTLMLILPTAYLALKLGFPLVSVFVVQLIFSIVALFLRLIIVRRMIGLQILTFLKMVFLPIFKTIIPVIVISYLCSQIVFPNEFIRFLVLSSQSLIVSLLCFWMLGMSANERIMVSGKVKGIVSKFKGTK